MGGIFSGHSVIRSTRKEDFSIAVAGVADLLPEGKAREGESEGQNFWVFPTTSNLSCFFSILKLLDLYELRYFTGEETTISPRVCKRAGKLGDLQCPSMSFSYISLSLLKTQKRSAPGVIPWPMLNKLYRKEQKILYHSHPNLIPSEWYQIYSSNRSKNF